MPAVAALVFAGNNRLRYLITGDGEGGAAVIPSSAGASPDLQTDTLAGPLKQIATVRANGLGTVPPGIPSQAQMRALLLSDSAGANVGNSKVPRAICRYTPRTTAAGTVAAAVDANVDGGTGDPFIEVTIGANSDGYLDIELANGAGISQ